MESGYSATAIHPNRQDKDFFVSNVVPPRGMRDMLPAQAQRRHAVIDAITQAYRRYGYQQIETPAVESLRYLLSGEGGDNEKLMYRVMKRGLDAEALGAAETPDDLADLGLRYDLTVPLARFFAAHRAHLPTPFRSIQIGPVWRAERPQRGRYRQLTQCDIDIFGEPGVIAEVELIKATVSALDSIGIREGMIRVNDRRILTAMMTSCGFDTDDIPAALIQVDKVDKIGIDGVGEQIASRWSDIHAGKIVDLLNSLAEPATRMDVLAECVTTETGAAGVETLKQLLHLLDSVGGAAPLTIELDPTLVRGMGYYTGPVFEIAHPQVPGSLGGGGRYDGMIERISGASTPACGFSIGFERVMDLLESREVATGSLTALLHDATDATHALVEAERMRADGIDVVMFVRARNRRAQLERLAEQGVTEVIDLRHDAPTHG